MLIEISWNDYFLGPEETMITEVLKESTDYYLIEKDKQLVWWPKSDCKIVEDES